MSDAESHEHEFGTEPIDGHVTGNGVRLHYFDWGRAPSPAIILLHGGGLTAHSWDVVCDLLRGEYRCVALDLRGHGDSGWAPDVEYALEAHAADLRAVVDSLSLDRFVVVGHSLGGLIALTFAGRSGDRLLGLVLVDTGPHRARLAGRERLRAFMDGPQEHATVEEFVERALLFNPRRPRERLRRSLLHNLRRTPRGTWAWKYDRRIADPFRSGDQEARYQRLIAAAGTVRCPVLVVQGEESEHFHPEDAEATAALFRSGRWIGIPGAGHTVQGDRPYDLTRVLREFLSATLA